MRRTILSSVIAAASFAFCATASAQEAPPSQFTPEQQAEIAAAEANGALVTNPGRWLSGAEAVYLDEERALGHHGRADVRGVLGLDGRLRYATIVRSTRAPVLDERALEAALAAEYRPAQDASGNPIVAMVTVPMSFYSFTSSEGVGAAMYTCPQFVADMDWFKATWSEEDLRNHYLFLLVRGLGAMSITSGARGITGIESNESYMARWNRAIETCRDHPNWRFTQAMRPEGEIIERMAAARGRGRR